MNCFSAREGGFSLVELMVAVGIIGIMSSFAVPKYQKFRVNAAQSEAQATLSSVYTLQQLYYTENDHYGNFHYKRTGGPGNPHEVDSRGDDIGFKPPKSARYLYTGERYDGEANPATINADAVSFKVTADAEKALGSCVGKDTDKVVKDAQGNDVTIKVGDVDKWCINENKVLENTHAGDAHQPCGSDDVKSGGC